MELDVLSLSRIQFAFTIFFHFIFVPLTIGLVIIMAVVETKYARTLNPVYRQMSDFWGKLFVINMVLGVVTGITMEFQFGTNWSEYSKFMGDIFGAPLAIEAMLAFFLESTFIAIWFFGKDRISHKLRAFSMWMVALGTMLSALWIITANGFMQNPVGYELVVEDGVQKVVLSSFRELVTNPYAWFMFFHTVVACFIVGAIFVMGISAWHLARNNEVPMFKKSFKYAAVLGVFAATITPVIGHEYAQYVAEVQPAKAASFDAVYETGTQDMYPFMIINSEGEVLFEGPAIPGMGSWLYTGDTDGVVTGLDDIPDDEEPPIAPVFYGFRIMVGIGMLLIMITWYALYISKRDRFDSNKRFLKVLPWLIPLPYIAINVGWMVAEVGRQPWAVYGLMKTEDAVSPIPEQQVWFSLICLFVFYGVLLVANLHLQFKYARKGPAPIPAHPVFDDGDEQLFDELTETKIKELVVVGSEKNGV